MGSAFAGAVAHVRDAAEARRDGDARPRLTHVQAAVDDRQRRANLRLALILATVAAVFFVGFVAKMVWLGA